MLEVCWTFAESCKYPIRLPCTYQGREARCRRRERPTGRRPACKGDTAADWRTDSAYTTVYTTGYTCWTADTDYSTDHSVASAVGTGTAEDRVDTEDTGRRQAHTGC